MSYGVMRLWYEASNLFEYIWDSAIMNSLLKNKVMNQYSFERLDVWKETIDLTKDIYIVTREFPLDEKFGISSQIRRAAISVSSNIVEGSYRKSMKEKFNFMNIAYSSLMELLSQVILCYDLGYISEEQYLKLRESVEIVSKKLASLSKYFNNH
jgi:four helix bundle protein